MKPQNQQGTMRPADTGEETLRVVANLPAPEGLTDRVQTRLRTAPRSARVLSWPASFAPGGWGYPKALRGVAAAAIVCVAVGGGWRIYSRVQPAPTARVIVMPTPASTSRGFSTAGSMHTPDPRPVIIHQIATPQSSRPAPGQESGQADPVKKDQAKNRAIGRTAPPAPPSQ